MNVYLLLDRSGSMGTLWNEAIGSINGYVKNLTPATKVYLATFDNVSYDVIRDCKAKEWKDVKSTEVTPRGVTPLYDSCGKIMSEAESKKSKKTMLVVMTDGYENASTEYSKEAIKARVEAWDKKDWEVVFLGANFDKVDDVSKQVGVTLDKTISYAQGTFNVGMNSLAASTRTYMSTGERVKFDDSIRAQTSKKPVA